MEKDHWADENEGGQKKLDLMDVGTQVWGTVTHYMDGQKQVRVAGDGF